MTISPGSFPTINIQWEKLKLGEFGGGGGWSGVGGGQGQLALTHLVPDVL